MVVLMGTQKAGHLVELSAVPWGSLMVESWVGMLVDYLVSHLVDYLVETMVEMMAMYLVMNLLATQMVLTLESQYHQ